MSVGGGLMRQPSVPRHGVTLPELCALHSCTAGDALSFYSHFGKELQYEAIKLRGLFEIDGMSCAGHFR